MEKQWIAFLLGSKTHPAGSISCNRFNFTLQTWHEMCGTKCVESERESVQRETPVENQQLSTPFFFTQPLTLDP